MRGFWGGVVLAAAGLLIAPATAGAITIAPDCDTCGDHNTGFDLTFAQTNDAQNIYTATVVATYGTPVDFSYINSLGFKIEGLNESDFESLTVAGPAGEGAWSGVLGGLSNSGNSVGCDAGPNAAFACSQSAPGAAPPGPDTWIFTFNLADALANLDLANLAGAFKVGFTDAQGEKEGSILSEDWSASTTTDDTTTDGSTVPEPATLLLFGGGLALVGRRVRRALAS